MAQPRLTGLPTGSSIWGSPGKAERQWASQSALSPAFQSSYQRRTNVPALVGVHATGGGGEEAAQVVGRDHALLLLVEPAELFEDGGGLA